MKFKSLLGAPAVALILVSCQSVSNQEIHQLNSDDVA